MWKLSSLAVFTIYIAIVLLVLERSAEVDPYVVSDSTSETLTKKLGDLGPKYSCTIARQVPSPEGPTQQIRFTDTRVIFTHQSRFDTLTIEY